MSAGKGPGRWVVNGGSGEFVTWTSGEPVPRFLGLRLRLYLRQLGDLPDSCAWAWRERRAAGVADELRLLTTWALRRELRMLVLEQELAAVDMSPPPAGIEIGPLIERDWRALEEIASVRTLRFFRRRLARGGRTCLVARRDGRAVGYSWLSDRLEPDIETYPLPLPPDTVYAWDLYVAAHARGDGIGTALVRARLAYARERGFLRAWRIVDPGNAPSLRTAEKTGGGVCVVGAASFSKRPGRATARYEPRPRRDLPAAGKVVP